MDPLTLLVTVLSAGAAAAAKTTVTEAVKDAYGALKRRISERFAAKPELANAVHQLETRPDSEGRKSVVREELQTVQADQDIELRALAQKLMDLLQKEKLLPGATTYQANQAGSGGLAQGEGSVAAGQGGVAVGGDVHGGVNVPRPDK